MLPAERGDVRQEFIRNEVAPSPQLPDGAVEIDGVAAHDRRCDQAEAGG